MLDIGNSECSVNILNEVIDFKSELHFEKATSPSRTEGRHLNAVKSGFLIWFMF